MQHDAVSELMISFFPGRFSRKPYRLSWVHWLALPAALDQIIHFAQEGLLASEGCGVDHLQKD